MGFCEGEASIEVDELDGDAAVAELMHLHLRGIHNQSSNHFNGLSVYRMINYDNI